MSISIKANPHSNVIVAPEREVSEAAILVPTHVNWTTDTGANITTDTGAIIEFRTLNTTTYRLSIKANPYSNEIVAPEKP